MTMTHNASPYKTGFGPFAPEVYRLSLPNPYRNGVLIESAGIYGNVLRLLLSLVLPDEQLNKGLDMLDKAIAKITDYGTASCETRGRAASPFLSHVR